MIKDEKIIIAWRTLMEVMKVTGNIMFYDIEIRTIVDALNELQKLRDNRDKAIEYINDNVAVYAFNNKDLPHWEFNDDDIKELLEILRGKDENN